MTWVPAKAGGDVLSQSVRRETGLPWPDWARGDDALDGGLSSKSSSRRVMRPASILEKSRMSLMMVRRACPLRPMVSASSRCRVSRRDCWSSSVAENSVHRRTDLVAHRRQKLALRPVRSLPGPAGELFGATEQRLQILLAGLQVAKGGVRGVLGLAQFHVHGGQGGGAGVHPPAQGESQARASSPAEAKAGDDDQQRPDWIRRGASNTVTSSSPER